MRKRIYNGGIEHGLLLAAKEDGLLSESDEIQLNYLESLPKNQWLELDVNGKLITTQEADERQSAMLGRYKKQYNS